MGDGLVRGRNAHRAPQVPRTKDAGRSCLDIATQLQAVESAITQAKRTLVQDHLDHCLDEVLGDLPTERRQPIDEFKQITKFL